MGWMDEYLDAWNSHDAERVASFMADGAIYEDVALGQRMTGHDEIVAFVNNASADFSTDFRFETITAMSTDDWYALEWTMSGTHDRETPGLGMTNKSFSIRGASVGTLENGKIKLNRDYWNMADFLIQVGILPAPAVAAA